MRDDLYTDEDYGAEAFPPGFMEMRTWMERTDKALRDMKKKRKHKKGGGKSKKSKKLKKRLKALEKQNEKIIEFLTFTTSQKQLTQSAPWWFGAVEKGVPKVFDFASAVVQSKRPVVQYLPARSQLLLTDSSDRK